MRRLLAALIFAAMPQVATAQVAEPDYWLVASADAPDGGAQAAYFIDTNRVTISGTTRRAWVLGHFARDAEGVFAGVDRIHALKEFDCVGRRLRDLQLTVTFTNAERGSRTSTQTSEWVYAVPDSTGDGMLWCLYTSLTQIAPPARLAACRKPTISNRSKA